MNKLLTLALTLSLIGCKEPLDKNFEAVSGNYKVGYLGTPTENIFVQHFKDMGMMTVVVNKKVKRIGFNERFAIIERLGNYNDLGVTALDTSVVRYYIVDMTRNQSIMDKDYMFGPATYHKFLTRKEELGIGQLEFTKKFAVD